MNDPQATLESQRRHALLLVTSLFFMWGLAYGLLDVLNKHFQESLGVSRAHLGLSGRRPISAPTFTDGVMSC